jgi:hypothetical protein
MPHKPEDNPLIQLRRELGNIEFIVGHHTRDDLPPGFLARLAFAAGHLDRLSEEQATLKAAFKTKAREANLYLLKVKHWQAQYERSEAWRNQLLNKVHQLEAERTTANARIDLLTWEIRQQKGEGHAP